MKQFVQAEDLYRLKLVSDPLIAADGKTVVYIRKQANKADKKYYSNLVMIKPDSTKLVNLTSGKVNDASPVLHPDGCVLYFMR